MILSCELYNLYIICSLLNCKQTTDRSIVEEGGCCWRRKRRKRGEKIFQGKDFFEVYIISIGYCWLSFTMLLAKKVSKLSLKL